MKKIFTLPIFTLLLLSQLTTAAPKLTASIYGISGELKENTEKRLTGITQAMNAKPRVTEFKTFIETGKNEIKAALAPFGYFEPQIHGTLRQVSNENWYATFKIKPGKPVRIKQLDLTFTGKGKSDTLFQKLWRSRDFHKGDILNTETYTKFKDSLLDLAATRGYFDAKITNSQVAINLKQHSAKITLHFDSGQRYELGKVIFKREGKTSKYLSEKFLQRYIKFCPGHAYHNKHLVKLQQDLAGSPYFQNVVVSPNIDQAKNKQVPVTATLTPAKAKYYQFGLGYGTDTGARGQAGIKLNRITETGHYFDATVKGATNSSGDRIGSFKAEYNIPGRDPTIDLYKLSSELTYDSDDEIGTSNNFVLNGSYITKVKTWQQTLGLSVNFDRSVPIASPSVNTINLIPSAQWLKVKSDDPLNPTKGYKINFSIRGASKNILGKSDFLQAHFDTKFLYPLTSTTRFIFRGELGALAINQVQNLPLSLQFFAGGAQSVRGYEYREIGKNNSINNSGRALTVGSVELQQKIYGPVYLAVFADSGNVSNSYFSPFKSSIGGGLVIRTPIGALNASLAKQLDTPGKPIKFVFSMGPEL